MPMRPPNTELLDYWATMSSCLTDLQISMDTRDKPLLQPAYLNELTRLTRLEIGEDGSLDSHDNCAFELPELKILELKGVSAGNLELQCLQLEVLSTEWCTIGKLYLQASLEHLYHESSTPILVHEGFPITNLLGLTYLSVEECGDNEAEAVLFQGLPLMARLRILSLSLHTCSLPPSLPSSLRAFTLSFSTVKGWDSAVIPLVQQLPRVESIRISASSQHSGSFGCKSLDHDLRPFLAMESLKLLQLGDPDARPESRVWKPSALRQLGELEAEVMRLGKDLEIVY